jgi:hypothetical protein
MKAVYYLGDEPLGAEIRLTARGLVPVGPGRWLADVVANKPAQISDREYLYRLMREHRGYLTVRVLDDNGGRRARRTALRRYGPSRPGPEPSAVHVSDLVARCRRLETLVTGLMREHPLRDEGNDPMLYLERQEYLAAARIAVAGRTALATPLGRPFHGPLALRSRFGLISRPHGLPLRPLTSGGVPCGQRGRPYSWR